MVKVSENGITLVINTLFLFLYKAGKIGLTFDLWVEIHADTRDVDIHWDASDVYWKM